MKQTEGPWSKRKSFCYLFMDSLFIHVKSEIYDFVIGEIFYFTKRKKKRFRGPHEVGHTHTQNGKMGTPPYGPFLHTHRKNVTFLGGPSNAPKRVVRADAL